MNETLKALSNEEIELKSNDYIQDFNILGIKDFVLSDLSKAYADGYMECQKLLYREIEKLREYEKLKSGFESNVNQVILTREQAADYLHISLATFDKLKIPFTRVIHKKLYFKSVIDDWLSDNME